MKQIHPTAIIEDGAELHKSVTVGPFSIIESDVKIGEGCVIDSSVRIFRGTSLGRNNRVGSGAMLGCEPQDLTFDPANSKPLVIGENNHIKEGVNISRGVKTEEGTLIGNGNYFMCGFHAGHDCRFGNNNIFGPNSTIAGHVGIGDKVFVSGLVGIHQFTFIGDHAMLGGCSKVVKDVPPYATCDGNPARLVGLNATGLKRSGFDPKTRAAIKQAYKTLFLSGLNISQAVEQLKGEELIEEVEKLVRFIEKSDRGVTGHK
ncbi:MAG: UDP-N-acetylglucosamine acyltransferase [Gammaproteobacteria bacterium (ex Lamellibrachia satsuma)]|nr:MAG: acyl-ACP--UDP-N-acetylglucosamine O-acyltransferase [Gammaproteobacteria bacterium (ex Lamellibrachia satsuma)]RRS33129.1 MAG: UDP-N-acetylglucosamine acyltransferase [Gammaproteobacteria bacterium (ex Lamellibrachia satsuma)]RRS36273.1 MAG: UDP-N-acetylglucosamine acyltransferase [Gammaproteobacteria bacterium (ex Lamellibrachia satsuma)]